MDESIARIGIPLEVVLISFMVMSLVMVTATAVWRNSSALRRILFGSLLGEYGFLVLYSTVIRRNSVGYYRMNLMPFWNYDEILVGSHEGCLEMFLNVLMFIPVGLLLPLCMRRAALKRVLLLSVVSSFVIELAQLVTRLGTYETDDIIHNAVGCAIGWSVVWGMRKAFGG